MAGAETPELAAAAVAGGADIVELGCPFSDPLADGPVIRRAAERALAQGMRTGPCLEVLAATRGRLPDTPLIPMTYSSLLEAYGWERFAADAHPAGATSLIVADLPAGARRAGRALGRGVRRGPCLGVLAPTGGRLPAPPLIPMTYSSLLEASGWERFAADAHAAGATSLIVADLPAGERPELKRVQLVAPTSTDERIRLAAEHSDGWLYLVTVTGTTGARDDLSPALAGLVERARAATELPLYAGFGISTPEQARAAAELADGIAVGTSAVEAAEGGPERLKRFTQSLRKALDLAKIPA